MDAGFIQYLAEQRGFQPGDTIATKQQYDAMYKQYLKDTSGGGDFTPSTGMATNAVSAEVTPYFMSSPNSAQPMSEKRPPLKPVSGKDGKAYNYNPVTGTYAPALIEGTTNQFEMDPKSSRLTELMEAVEGAPAAEEQESPNFLTRMFGGGQAAPAPTPSPTPRPAMAGTNAPVPVATPAAAYSSEQDVLAAARAGQISLEQAQNILVNQFGLDP